MFAMTTTRATIYLDSDLHRMLKVKAASTRTSMSELVNQAVRQSLAEDHEDLNAFEQRAAEPVMSYEALLADLKAHGKI